MWQKPWKPADGSSPRVRGTVAVQLSEVQLDRFIPARAGNGCCCCSSLLDIGSSPRVRGAPRRIPTAVGSSPRVRGTVLRLDVSLPPGWFIPARAGNGGGDARSIRIRPVHPRACGERSPLSRSLSCTGGSSPRVRGTVNVSDYGYPTTRFIPARAGNGSASALHGLPLAVHPRACGERGTAEAGAGANSGSSPRVRGTAAGRAVRFRLARFIPARAGNGHARHRGRPAHPVHPRACGERTGTMVATNQNPGSSPRVRGTVAKSSAHGIGTRFIPARAGNGDSHRPPLFGPPVHPRACGERNLDGGAADRVGGSSPRVRGTARRKDRGCGEHRFIPARAGNGIAGRANADRRPVHPRACGERQAPGVLISARAGSSPRVRGTVADGAVNRVEGRFIPARAGNGLDVMLFIICDLHAG